VIVAVAEQSQIGQARRLAGEQAKNAGLSDEKAGRVALVATELATNLVKHAGQGNLILNRFADADGEGVELVSLDKGPGIADLNRALSDGYSTAGSLGGGLGAVVRQADRFAIFSRSGLGTAVLARFTAAPAPKDREKIGIGAVVEPYPGERVCGDGWAYAGGPNSGAVDGGTVLVVDGSGHGEQAARAAAIAIDTFLANSDRDCVRLVETIHRALGPTRGAALAVARLDRKERVVHFVGIGNIVGSVLVEGQLRHMVSHNGTAGHIAPRIREFTYPFIGEPTLILHSDGMSTRWDLGSFPGLSAAHPALIAGVLFREYRRGRDDCSIVVLRASR
jgi:anti-sigma regulatory factor (Ser/Thr protein kinase)